MLRTPSTEIRLAQQDIDQYAEDGVVVLRGVFKDWISPLQEGISQLMAAPSPLERSYQPSGDVAPFFQDLCNWQRIPTFSQFVHQSPAARIASQLMQSRSSRFFHDHVLVKEPGTSVVTPWHQDQPYYCVDGELSVSFWIPLDPVPQATSLRCVAGSHRWRTHRAKRFDGADLYDGDDMVEMPDIDANPQDYRILAWAMQPGDAVAFNFRTIHGAAGNPAQGHRRRVFSARWVGDGATFIDRQGKGSPPFSHLTLKTGERLEGADFPLIHQE
jgi:ectoine hydroxylase-related dioxygenase (phytanoyl-CoA dioxygenase family)